MVDLALLFCLCVASPLLELKVLFLPCLFGLFLSFLSLPVFYLFSSLTLSSQSFAPGDEHGVLFRERLTFSPS